MAKKTSMKDRPSSRRRRHAGKMLSKPENLTLFRIEKYAGTVFSQTVLARIVAAFVVLWLLFAAALFLADRSAADSTITSYGDALYWTVAAFSTAGIADTPKTGFSQLVGAVWIVIGSILFFGTIVATITGYFLRPTQRPVNQIIDTIEFNLERIDDLTVDELALLKKTSDSLIMHMERLKQKEEAAEAKGVGQ